MRKDDPKSLLVRQVLVMLALDTHDPLLTRVVYANATLAGEVIVRGTNHTHAAARVVKKEALRTLMARFAPSWHYPTEQRGKAYRSRAPCHVFFF